MIMFAMDVLYALVPSDGLLHIVLKKCGVSKNMSHCNQQKWLPEKD